MLFALNKVKPERGPCGHSYPDVMRVRDYYSNGTCIRVFDCIKCRRYEFEIPEWAYSKGKISSEEIKRTRESLAKK